MEFCRCPFVRLGFASASYRWKKTVEDRDRDPVTDVTFRTPAITLVLSPLGSRGAVGGRLRVSRPSHEENVDRLKTKIISFGSGVKNRKTSVIIIRVSGYPEIPGHAPADLRPRPDCVRIIHNNFAHDGHDRSFYWLGKTILTGRYQERTGYDVLHDFREYKSVKVNTEAGNQYNILYTYKYVYFFFSTRNYYVITIYIYIYRSRK